MFYDLPDPLKFAKEINSILKDGVWHIELSYMPMMIKIGLMILFAMSI